MSECANPKDSHAHILWFVHQSWKGALYVCSFRLTKRNGCTFIEGITTIKAPLFVHFLMDATPWMRFITYHWFSTIVATQWMKWTWEKTLSLHSHQPNKTARKGQFFHFFWVCFDSRFMSNKIDKIIYINIVILVPTIKVTILFDSKVTASEIERRMAAIL